MLLREHRAISVSGDTRELAQLAVDLEQARAAINLWQYAVLRILAETGALSMASDTKLLDGVLSSVAGWLELLRLREKEGDDKRLVAAFTRETMECAEWAEEARLALRLMVAIRAADPAPC